MAVAEPNILTNEKYRKYKFVEFFYGQMRPDVLEHIKEDLDDEELDMLAHIEHCKELQKQAQDKTQAEMWKKFWGQ